MPIQLLILSVVLASCSKAPPQTLALMVSDHKTDTWIGEACDHQLAWGTTLIDYSLPEGMAMIHVTQCHQMFTNVVDARVETQGNAEGVCAVRIGPSRALATVDARSIERLFTDKQVGARVAAMVAPGVGPEWKELGMVDGFRVAVHQFETVRASMFYLVIDGCNHGPDARPEMSHID